MKGPPTGSEAAVTAPPVRQTLSAPPAFAATVSVPPQPLLQPSERLATDPRPAPVLAPSAPQKPAVVSVEQAVAFSIMARVSVSDTGPGASAPQPALAAPVVVASAAVPAVGGQSSAPVSMVAMPVAVPSHVAPVLRDPRLPRQGEERDRLPGLVALPETGPLRVGLRAEASVAAPTPAATANPPPATGIDIGFTSDRLGAVRIGIDGAPGELRVSLGLSPAAAAIVAADAPRLIADLAATGARLQSLDVSGGGFTGGQAPSPGQQQPQSPAPSLPRAGLSVAVNPIIPVRASTADRYA